MGVRRGVNDKRRSSSGCRMRVALNAWLRGGMAGGCGSLAAQHSLRGFAEAGRGSSEAAAREGPKQPGGSMVWGVIHACID